MSTFAACIPAIISGGIAERAKFETQIIAGCIFVGIVYPLVEGLIWGRIGILGESGRGLGKIFGFPFHDYAGSVVVHSTGGWIALPAIIILGPRLNRYIDGKSNPLPAHSIPYLSLGSWLLMVGWFGFNVASAVKLSNISGLVAVNPLLAMIGGTLGALIFSHSDAIFIYNGALAGLIAICSGSDVVHPVSAIVIGVVAGILFAKIFVFETEKPKIDDVLGVWPLHGICGVWGGIATGIFGYKFLGGVGEMNFFSQLIGTFFVVLFSLICGFIVYKCWI